MESFTLRVSRYLSPSKVLTQDNFTQTKNQQLWWMSQLCYNISQNIFARSKRSINQHTFLRVNTYLIIKFKIGQRKLLSAFLISCFWVSKPPISEKLKSGFSWTYIICIVASDSEGRMLTLTTEKLWRCIAILVKPWAFRDQ